MRIDIVTIFPEYFGALDVSLLGRAREDGILDVKVHDLRAFTHDRHRTVDDKPYGGGAGMVMKPEPWGEALDAILDQVAAPGATTDADGDANADGDIVDHDAASVVGTGLSAGAADARPRHRRETDPIVIFPSPAGEVFTQAMARELSGASHIVFGCGRYEGIDQRVFEYAESRASVRLVSLGDYVLNGGEVAVMAMIEAIGRLIPGVIGNPESLVEESHEDGLLEYPSYTKPAEWRGYAVPPVLTNGNHGAIAVWRREQQLERTRRVRPDLLPPAQ
ncbi:tRNA (guanosine(37)-N1)-methyltransferase TrmD [Subtercola sp. PAMC28395]|uniref:tRNA (guanosine(37)-N1)-methyltransferase TrmD n=1 Tax=Subtercola sp. PAMC28395 TaxID=2846775 RepID=UPI001C0AC384|nr:tRNA (guanosine(37)-N1)-methyltransferase TrmD [Subtercola sp. PAMC28395]QWT22846.1 tRNA (guanosine(37)-N1)-methyltransferase TrmD [Subtercola sp. PAMC28395]